MVSMEIIIYVALSGMAVAYLIELIQSFSSRAVSNKMLKQIITAPLSYLACWFFGIVGFQLAVCGIATAFIALALLLLINKPDATMYVRRPF